MLSRRAFLKLTAALPPLTLLTHHAFPHSYRVLLPTDADTGPLAELARTIGRTLQPTYYTDNPETPLRNLTFDLISVPARIVPRLIRENRLIRLPPLDLTRLGPNWARGHRPHDPENAYSLPRDWGYISPGGYRRSHTFTPPSPLLWADDWAIPTGTPDPILSTNFLTLWLASPLAARLADATPPPRADLRWPIALARPGDYNMPRPTDPLHRPGRR